MIFGRRSKKHDRRSAAACQSCGGDPARANKQPLICPACRAASQVVPTAIAHRTLEEGVQARACTACEQVTIVVEPDMICPDCRKPRPDVNDRLRARFARVGPGDPADAPCVGCGYHTSRPNPPSLPLDILVDCRGCGGEIAVPEDDFPVGQGTNLMCGCGTRTVVPAAVWCPKCGQHIRARGIAEIIRDANR